MSKRRPTPVAPRAPQDGPVTCPYCGHEASLVGGDIIYPHRPDLAEKAFYLCRPCDAYVGCHPGTRIPLGFLADAQLRRAKHATHAVFDPLWRSGRMSRKAAYGWLARRLGIPKEACHIGWFDLEQCSAATLSSRKAGEAMLKRLKPLLLPFACVIELVTLLIAFLLVFKHVDTAVRMTAWAGRTFPSMAWYWSEWTR